MKFSSGVGLYYIVNSLYLTYMDLFTIITTMDLYERMGK